MRMEPVVNRISSSFPKGGQTATSTFPDMGVICKKRSMVVFVSIRVTNPFTSGIILNRYMCPLYIMPQISCGCCDADTKYTLVNTCIGKIRIS